MRGVNVASARLDGHDGKDMAGIHALSDAVEAAAVGGKAAALGALERAGFRVPDGFVIAADAAVGGEEIVAAFRALGVPFVAVRSSAAAEDGKSAAWAGQFETYLNVDETRLMECVERCRASGSSRRATEYAAHATKVAGNPRIEFPGTLVPSRIAVIVQAMVPAEVAGVAFSVDPVTGERAVVIEAVRGLGDDLVSGRVAPDPDALSSARTEEVVALVRAIESHFGYPVDVEWAFADGVLYVLQARPITTLRH